VGKTTMARLMADAFDAQFITISAVLGGVKDIREAVERARRLARRPAGGARIVFVDEVHRFNKSQQDAFLPHVERPVHLHRRDHREPVVRGQLGAAVARHGVCAAAAGRRRSGPCWRVRRPGAPPPEAAARTGWSPMPMAMPGACSMPTRAWRWPPAREAGLKSTTPGWSGAGRALRRYDKGGEQFYDTISALHKSVRGSDPDAALYWLVRMLDGGADPRYMARR
jgi:putative ATPase